MRRGRRLLAAALCLLACAIGTDAHADEHADAEDAQTLFRVATDALAGDRPNEAIAKLEALGDRGVVDAVVSYDRGLAYSARVRAGAEQAGDLGRAAHGFEEARSLTRDPTLATDATNALSTVRAEVARRRVRAGESIELDHGVSLGRSIVELLPENAWAILGAVFAIVLSVAIFLPQRLSASRARVGATTAAAIGGTLLAVSAICAWAARDARLHLREGVVVTAGARLLDPKHVAIDGVAPIAEGARVRLLDETGGFSHVVVGRSTEGWLPSSVVLPIAKR